MPVQLPSGQIPVLRALSDDQRLVVGERVQSWRFDVLDRQGAYLGVLDGVQPEGNVSFSASASVKGSGELTVHDVDTPTGPRHWDWLNVRIRPVARIDGIDREFPMGVWIPSVPEEDWTAAGRTWKIELLDRVSILDSDVYTDPTTGGLFASFAAGANIISIIRQIIADTGETSEAILDDPDAVLKSAKTYDAGTTKLQVVNDLLDTANYFSIFMDYTGAYRCEKYTDPASRPVQYEAVGPFVSGPTSIYSPEFSITRDIFSIPNRVVGILQGDGETEGLTSIAVNLDTSSPFSQPNRGRWITKILTDVSDMDQAALDLYVQKNLQSSMSVASSVPLTHAWMPELAINQVVAIRNPAASLDIAATVSKVTVNFDPTQMCSSEFTEVLTIS